MVRYFSNSADIGSSWEHVASSFWRRYSNPFSAHVLTEDVLHRELTADGRRLLSRRLLTKTSRLVPPRWAQRFLPGGGGGGGDNASRCVVHLLEDSVVDRVSRSLTTYTTNVSHAALMKVEERCVFRPSSSSSSSSSSSTQLGREVWISSGVYGFNRAIQEVALARYKANQRNAMKGLEYALSRRSGTDTTMKDEEG